MRRTHLRKRDNILKRVLFHAIGFNLALLVRERYGIGKPRTLQGIADPILLLRLAMAAVCTSWIESLEAPAIILAADRPFGVSSPAETLATSTTGC